MGEQGSWGRIGRALLGVLVVGAGLVGPGAVGTSGATMGPALDFTVDAGATITYVQPTNNPLGPLTVLSSESLTGSYTLRHDTAAPVGGQWLGFSSLHLESASGHTIDGIPGGEGSAQTGMVCIDDPAVCYPDAILQTVGIPGIPVNQTGYLSSYHTIGYEGSELSPSGQSWDGVHSNFSGIGIYRWSTIAPDSLDLVAYVTFHATRSGAPTDPPQVVISTPADGAAYRAGTSLTASYDCTDFSGTGISSCAGPVASGDALDTSTIGTHTFTVTGTDNTGGTSTVTNTYDVVPDTQSFSLDAGATFIPTVPTSSVPVTLLPAESLSGSFTTQLQDDPPGAGYHHYTVTALHLATTAGTTFDLVGGSLTCFDTYHYCAPQISLDATGLAASTTPTIQVTGMAIGQPSWEGPEIAPTGWNWSPPNVYIPAGIAMYAWGPTGLQMVGVLTFHATPFVPDQAAPDVTVSAPVDGGVYTLDQPVSASYSCTDTGGSGLASCAGTVPDGAPVDTSSPSFHDFAVDASDVAGNTTNVSARYEVLAGNVSAAVSGGETVTTDPGGLGASPAVPIQTTIAVPAGVAGQVSVAPQPAGPPPSGYVLFSRQLVLEGPPAPDPTTPYVVTFAVDASELNGTPPGAVDVFRNGTLVPACTGADATPDPCVASRAAAPDGSGDAIVTVRTTQFSTWTLGRRSLLATDATPGAIAQGVAHRSIVVHGQGFAPGAAVRVSGAGVTVNSTTWSSATALTLDVSAGGSAVLGARSVTVTNPDARTATCNGCLTVDAKPTITGTSPSSRPQGASHETVAVLGTGFQPGTVVTFSGTGITVGSASFVSSTRLDLDLSVATDATTGSRSVSVLAPDGGTATRSGAFTVAARPTVTSLNPRFLRRGQTVTTTVLGTGFAASFVTAGGSVSLGAGTTVTSVVRNSASKLTVSATVDPGAAPGPRDVTVANPDGGRAICSGCATVVADPTVTAITPAAAPRGATHLVLAVTGAGFAPGAVAKVSGSGVTVNTTTVSSDSSVSVDVSVSGSATLGARDVTVTNPDTGVARCVACFTVDAKPVITALSPASARRGSHLTVVLTGSGFQPGVVVAASGSGVAIAVLSTTPTSLTLDVTVDPTAAVGSRAVTVTNPDGGTATKSTGFKVT